MSLLSQYLTRLLFVRFLLLLFGMGAFMMGLDLMVNANSVMADGDSALASLTRYILLRSPVIVSDLIKIAALLAGLLTLTFLIRHGELAAIWNSGVSQFGLLRRLIPLAVMLGALQFVIDDRVVPGSVEALSDWGVVDDVGGRDRKGATAVTWIHVGPDILRIPQTNIDPQGLRDFTLFERDANGNLQARLDVGEARYRNGNWELLDITERRVAGGPVRHEDRRDWTVDLDVESLQHVLVHPRNLSLGQILHFTGGDGQGTWAPYLYETWLYTKLSNCLVPFLMLFLSVTLAQQSQRAGRIEFLLLGGIVIGFSFFIFNGITLAMGEVGILPPLIASSTPLLVFAAVAASVAFWHELKKAPS